MNSPVDRARNILVVASEEGGAELLSSMIKAKANKNYFFCMEEPATKIFAGKIRRMDLVDLDFINSNRRSIDLVLTSTSFISDHERRAISLAKKNKVKVASVLDHWIGYRQRFLPREMWKNIPVTWMNQLPDEVWVADRSAFEIVQKEKFPMNKIFRTNNQYLDDMSLLFENEENRKKGPIIKPKNDIKILYISEPVSEEARLMHADPKFRGFTEVDIVKAILQFLLENYKMTNLKFRFRLSPNDPPDKYDKLITGVSQIEKSASRNLIEDLLWANTVLGIESPDLVVALAAGKQVFSWQPETTLQKTCLPHKAIRHIGALNAEFAEKLELLVNPPPDPVEPLQDDRRDWQKRAPPRYPR